MRINDRYITEAREKDFRITLANLPKDDMMKEYLNIVENVIKLYKDFDVSCDVNCNYKNGDSTFYVIINGKLNIIDMFDISLGEYANNGIKIISVKYFTHGLLIQHLKEIAEEPTNYDKEALEFSVDLWNSFIKSDNIKKDDLDDFRQAIHTCQRIIQSRLYRQITKKIDKIYPN